MNDTRRALRGLYGITDAALLTDTGQLLDTVDAALRGGMSILQYRAKAIAQAQQIEQASALRALCHRYGALLLVNDNVELACQIAADGVHVGRDDAAIQGARAQLGHDRIIGCSCYNQLDLALEAQRLGADYVAFGRFFPSRTKPSAVQAPVELLAQAKAALDIPVCAIGGITTGNAASLIGQGADMIAVVQGLFGDDDVAQQAIRFEQLFGREHFFA